MATNNKSGNGSQRSARGFAAMDPARQREIASMGGKASHNGNNGGGKGRSSNGK
ncbi:MAG: KGG domain-containing protein [Candidatus Gracilibacteria bacterium]